jgi:hypothetical protein
MIIDSRQAKGGAGMWPSEGVASSLYNIANWGLIAGLVIGVISTILLVWMGNVKESYLKTNLTTTNRQLALLQTEAAVQQRRAATAEKDLLEFKEKLKYRVLTEEQRTSLIDALTPFKGQVVEIAEYKMNPEPAAFSGLIQSVLLLCGWDARVKGKIGGVNLPPGIWVLLEDGQQSKAADRLVEVLNKMGFSAEEVPRSRYRPTALPPGAIGLFVGPKP